MNKGVVKKCSRCHIIKPLTEFDNASQRQKEFKPYKVCRDCKAEKTVSYTGRICSKCGTYKKLECFEQQKDGRYKKRCKICTDYYKKHIKKCKICNKSFFSERSSFCSELCEAKDLLKYYIPGIDVNKEFTILNTEENYQLYGFSKNLNRNHKDGIWFIFINSENKKIALKLRSILKNNQLKTKATFGQRAVKKSSYTDKTISKYFVGELIGSQVIKGIDTPKRGFDYSTTCIKCGFYSQLDYYNHEKLIKGRLTPEREMNGKCKFCETGYATIPEKNSAFALHDEFLFSVIDESEIERLKIISPTGCAKVKVNCPKCGRTKNKMIKDLIREQSIGCVCGKGTSYSEKVFFELLNQLNVEFEREYNSNNFVPKTNKRYDFYLPHYSLIIEAHGEQHYTEIKKWGRLEDTQKNDVYKRKLAIKNGIEYYLEIDCRKSNIDYIRESIINSKLDNLFDLTKVDWEKCHKFAIGIYKGTNKEGK